jgi:hypothetical protein
MKGKGAITTTLLIASVGVVLLASFTSFYAGRMSAITSTTTEIMGVQIYQIQLSAGNETMTQNATTSPVLTFTLINFGPIATLTSVQISADASQNFTTFVDNEQTPIGDFSGPFVLFLHGATQKVIAGKNYGYSLTFVSNAYPKVIGHTETFVGVITALNSSLFR